MRRLPSGETTNRSVSRVSTLRQPPAVTGKPAAFQYVRTRGGLHVLDEQLTTEEYGMAVRKDSPELLQWLNTFIMVNKADGTLNDLSMKFRNNPLPALPVF